MDNALLILSRISCHRFQLGGGREHNKRRALNGINMNGRPLLGGRGVEGRYLDTRLLVEFN